jgi:hypothetical protein
MRRQRLTRNAWCLNFTLVWWSTVFLRVIPKHTFVADRDKARTSKHSNVLFVDVKFIVWYRELYKNHWVLLSRQCRMVIEAWVESLAPSCLAGSRDRWLLCLRRADDSILFVDAELILCYRKLCKNHWVPLPSCCRTVIGTWVESLAPISPFWPLIVVFQRANDATVDSS